MSFACSCARHIATHALVSLVTHGPWSGVHDGPSQGSIRQLSVGGGGCPLSTPPLTTGLDPTCQGSGGGGARPPKGLTFLPVGFLPFFFWQILAQKVFSSKIDLEFGCIGSDLPTCRFPPPTPGGWWVECQDWGFQDLPQMSCFSSYSQEFVSIAFSAVDGRHLVTQGML